MVHSGKLATLLLLPMALLVACGGAPLREESEEEVREVTLEPTIIEAERDGDGQLRVRDWTVTERFHRSVDALLADDYETARAGFHAILEVSEDDDVRRMSSYNLALAHEGLGRLQEAEALHAQVREHWAGSVEATYSYYRSAGILWELGRYEHILPLMEAVLRRSGLTPEDRMEAHLRAANAWLELRHFEEAEQALRHTLGAYEGVAAERARLRDDRMASAMATLRAEAHFQRGRIHHELGLQIRLRLPQERFQRDLVAKAEYYDAAREAYRQALTTGHPRWAAVASYRLGETFEDMYFDVLASEIPADYGELHFQLYFEELRQMLEPFLDQALMVYEAAFGMAFRINAEPVWIERLQDAIERVRAYRDEGVGWEAEHRLIIEQMHPRTPGFGHGLRFRLDEERDRRHAPGADAQRRRDGIGQRGAAPAARQDEARTPPSHFGRSE